MTEPTKIAVFGTLRFPPESVPAVLPHIRALVKTTYEVDGCIAYDVAEDISDPGLFRFSELWPSESSLHKHLAAPHIEPWRQIARENGLMDRTFTAYKLTDSFDV